MRYQVVTDGAFEAIDLANARLHLKVPSNITAEDDLIQDYIQVATDYVETRTRRICATSTWAGYLDEFPSSGMITINRNPVTSITSVQYYDANDTLQTLSTNDYYTDVIGFPARVYITSAPSISTRPNAVKINFVAGYSDIDSVPQEFKQAVRLLLTSAYEERTDFVTGTMVSQLPLRVENFINNLRIDEF